MSILVDAAKIPVGAMYAPFCRTQYAGMAEWDADIRRMAEMGFSCLHGFAEWWRIEKRKGEYDFTEIDCLIETSARRGVTPIVNVATQNGVGYYMPRWMQEEYAGAGVVDNEGRGDGVRSEYLTACLDDPWYQTRARAYLRAVAERYAGDSRLGGWIIWGEPMLTKGGKPICYCEHTLARFKHWLRGKYGHIEALNAVWGNEGPSQYADFDGVRPPTGQNAQRGSYASWADWRSFMEENFAGHIKAADSLFKECGAKQPTIVELFCHVGWGGLCNDLWALSKTADIIGVSNFLRPGRETELAMTVANSIALPLGKSVFVVEANGGPRYPNYDRRTPSPGEIVSEAVQMAGSGAKGLMYWCYRPRLSDYEGGAYGMCRNDGKPLPRAIAAGKISAQIAKASEWLLAAEWAGETAILYSNKIAHLVGADAHAEELAHAQQGAMKLLLDAHITPRLIDETWIAAGRLAEFKALLLPFAYALDEPCADRIAEFVRGGGCAIADQNLAIKRLDGVCYRTLPGAGFDALFGVEKEDILHLAHPAAIPANPYDIPVGNCLDILQAVDADVVETFGEYPLVARKAHGAGRAWYLAWQAFAAYSRQGGQTAFRKLVAGMLAQNGVLPFAALPEHDEKPSVDVSITEMVLPDRSKTITVVNPGYEAREIEVRLPGAAQAETLFDGNSLLRAARDSDGLRVRLAMDPWGAQTLHVR